MLRSSLMSPAANSAISRKTSTGRASCRGGPEATWMREARDLQLGGEAGRRGVCCDFFRSKMVAEDIWKRSNNLGSRMRARCSGSGVGLFTIGRRTEEGSGGARSFGDFGGRLYRGPIQLHGHSFFSRARWRPRALGFLM